MGDKLDRYPAMILACPAGMEDAGLGILDEGSGLVGLYIWEAYSLAAPKKSIFITL
jgi:hypothetical protein